jgi:polyisoprenoid-binding protein YceI
METLTTLADGAYAVNPAVSHLAWHGSKMIGKSHDGTVALKSGQLTISGGRLSGGAFVIDMTTIQSDEGLANLIQHLNSADFFDTANYPEARLTIVSVAADAAGAYRLQADLTIKGHTNPIEFTAAVGVVGGCLEADSDFTIDRSRWDIRFGSGKFFENLGDNLINDLIGFKVSLKAER